MGGGRLSKSIAVLTFASLLILCGCAATQKVIVSTTPSGADVTLVRYGVTKAEGSIPGISVGGTGDSFEDPPMTLGTAPVEYEFELEETDEQLSVGGLFVKVARKFTEGLIRAEKDGVVAERRVRFTGEPIVVDLMLPAE
jgi:hypothetical protein